MSQETIKFIWRCANCSNHFANITRTDGTLKQEKKCPKCKSLNILAIAENAITINCYPCNHERNGYSEDFPGNNFPRE